MYGWVFAAGLLLYVATCAPGLLWGDSAMFEYRVWSFDLTGELGLALSHPLYILLARVVALLPIGDVAYRVNLFSAVCAAATLPFAFHLIRDVTHSGKAAICGTALLAVSHTFWMHAVIAEVYALYSLSLLIELTLILKFVRSENPRWLMAALFVNGLTTSNHVLGLLHLPGYFLLWLHATRTRSIRPKHIPALLAAYLLGLGPYIALIIHQITAGTGVGAALHSALFGNTFAGKVLDTHFSLTRQAGRTAAYFLMNFPTPIAILAIPGMIHVLRDRRLRWFGVFLLSLFAVNFVFAFRYTVPDQYVFFMPCYVIAALLTGIGIRNLVSRSKGWAIACIALALLPAAVYEVAPIVMPKSGVTIGTKRDIPGRNTYSYFIRPRKNGEYSAINFTTKALDTAAPDGLLVADGTVKNALVYAREVRGIDPGVYLHFGPDLTPSPPVVPLDPDTVAEFVDRDAAFVCSNIVPYVPKWIADEYDLVPRNVIFQIVKRDREAQRD